MFSSDDDLEAAPLRRAHNHMASATELEENAHRKHLKIKWYRVIFLDGYAFSQEEVANSTLIYHPMPHRV
jgi:hypothetical protein